MDAHELNLEGHFDFVVSRTTFHHLLDVWHVLEKAKSLLNPGGRIVIVDNVSRNPTPPTIAYLVGALGN